MKQINADYSQLHAIFTGDLSKAFQKEQHFLVHILHLFSNYYFACMEQIVLKFKKDKHNIAIVFSHIYRGRSKFTEHKLLSWILKGS